ncbi:hypothetical protein [Azoarcus sp. DD4]|uniref:hypothetical protein n=1 Tax=Azoarcus sp. DD4 TaxID=2027405 RepID=UPI0011285050|nr:hypothetical protein [Azoarcus sp. DD4]
MPDPSESISSLLAAWPARMSDTVSRYVSLFAPNALSQPILPGWSFGNTYIVSEFNSKAPDTERRILAEHSYGRQIGRMMEALCVLVNERPDAKTHTALQNFTTLADEIRQIKERSVENRVARIEADLAVLRKEKPDDYEKLVKALAKGLAAGGQD